MKIKFVLAFLLVILLSSCTDCIEDCDTIKEVTPTVQEESYSEPEQDTWEGAEFYISPSNGAGIGIEIAPNVYYDLMDSELTIGFGD